MVGQTLKKENPPQKKKRKAEQNQSLREPRTGGLDRRKDTYLLQVVPEQIVDADETLQLVLELGDRSHLVSSDLSRSS